MTNRRLGHIVDQDTGAPRGRIVYYPETREFRILNHDGWSQPHAQLLFLLTCNVTKTRIRFDDGLPME